MLRKILRGLGLAVAALAAIAALLYATRSNPVGPVSGRALSGELISTPVTDWTFTDDHSLIAVETRPAAPHSVTTVCFTHEGALYVPAQGASAKSWPHYAVSNPRARILVDGKIYPVRATRVEDTTQVPTMLAAARAKYDFISDAGEIPDDVWLFRMDSAAADVAAP
jgi:hypothetical protein